MTLKECVKGAFAQMSSSKMRTFLTMLGMFIGIGSVILVLSLGAGVRGKLMDQFKDIGQGAINIQANDWSPEGLINMNDMEMIKAMPEIKTALMCSSTYGSNISDYKNDTKTVRLQGVPYNFEEVQYFEIVAGRNYTEMEEKAKTNLIVVGDTFAKVIYGRSDLDFLIGKTIELELNSQSHSFEIIGVFKTNVNLETTPVEQMSVYGQIPFETFDQITMYGDIRAPYAYTMAKEGVDTTEVAYQISRLLNKNHSVKEGFTAQSLTQFTEQLDGIMGMVTSFISLVAAISLLVGGIGIMNIMLVTVKERTREIGIRKAIGATNKEIKRQFLVEAMILTIIGGIIGLMLGYFGGLIVGAIAKLQIELTLGMVIFAVGTSSAIGIIFGVYPAKQAAKLDPIEALRYE